MLGTNFKSKDCKILVIVRPISKADTDYIDLEVTNGTWITSTQKSDYLRSRY